MISMATDTHSRHNSYAKARFNMVEGQIRTNRVTDEALLAALSETPRHLFVPASLESVAYVDKSLKIAPGRYLMEPLFLSRLLQEALPEPTDTVLVIGAGSGYAMAILASLVASVVGVESDDALVDKAEKNLSTLGAANAKVVHAPLEHGCPASGPYDLILIDGMVDAIPVEIFAQLKDHGRLVTIVSREGHCGAGTFYGKLGGAVSGRALFDATMPPLPGFTSQPVFEL